jgi:hypothetical protein
MLLSPSSRSSAAGFSGDSTRHSGSQFTMFLTAPLQAFCLLIGNNGIDIDRVPIFFMNFFRHYSIFKALT